jgi:hypothetical protein
MALVQSKTGEMYGYVNEDYHLVIPLEYDFATQFESGRAMVSKNGFVGYINRNNKSEIPLIYTRVYGYSEQLYCVQHPQKGWGYIDWDGNSVIGFGFRDAKSFSEGLGAVENFLGSWGFINKQGVEVITYQYEAAMPFKGGLAPVKKNGKWGFITKSNRYAISPTYDEVLTNEFYASAKGQAKVRIKDQTFFINARGEKQ